MRVVTWNVNSVKQRVERLLPWLDRRQPDVVCLQETKLADPVFDKLLGSSLAERGYEVALNGEAQWNGVAILSRVGLSDVVAGLDGGPGFPHQEARAVAATCGGIRVHSVYVPNGRVPDSDHYKYKLAWLDALRSVVAAGPADAMVCGDMNIAPTDADVFDPAAYVGQTHVTNPEREALASLQSVGLHDVVRDRWPDSRVFTYWDYRAGMFHQDLGMRIDLVLASGSVASRVAAAWVDREARKGSKPSDHAPVIVDLDTAPDGNIGPVVPPPSARPVKPGSVKLPQALRTDLPPGLPAHLGPSVFSTRPSKELIADTVIIAGPAWEPAHGIVVEAQQERSEAKRQKLPRYAAALWLESDCPVDVLVICPDEATAGWYARPVPTEVPGYTFQPRVLHPSRVPSITSARQAARDPAMAVLSVAFHGQDRAVADAFVAGVGSLGDERGLQYYEYGYNMSPRAVCAILEELVTTTHWPVYSPFAKLHYGKGKAEGLEEGRSEGLIEGRTEGLIEGRTEGLIEGRTEGPIEGRTEGLTEGLIEGERQALLEVLQARGLEVTEDQRERVAECIDLDQLKAWVRGAVTAASTSDLFAQTPRQPRPAP